MNPKFIGLAFAGLLVIASTSIGLGAHFLGSQPPTEETTNSSAPSGATPGPAALGSDKYDGSKESKVPNLSPVLKHIPHPPPEYYEAKEVLMEFADDVLWTPAPIFDEVRELPIYVDDPSPEILTAAVAYCLANTAGNPWCYEIFGFTYLCDGDSRPWWMKAGCWA